MVVKMPVPIMFEMTSAVALTMPSWRRRVVVRARSMIFRQREAGAHQGLAAVAHIDGAGDVGGGVGTKEQRQVGQFVLGSETPQRNVVLNPAPDFGSWRQTPHAFGVVGGAGRDAVGANAVGSPFDGQAFE